MLVALPLAAMGCSDDADGHLETTSHAVTSPCTPDHEYEECVEIDLSQIEYWQGTLPNPDWRTVEPNSDPDIDYDVIIDVDELNGGVIPTRSNQGHYNDWQQYYSAKSALLGVDYGDDAFNLVIIGSTVKADDGQPTNSWGHFVYDALSDENGEVWVDNQEESQNIFNPYRSPDFDQTQTNLLHHWPTELQDTEVLEDGGWKANLKMFHREGTSHGGHMPIPSKVALQIDSVRRSFNNNLWFSCNWDWTPGFIKRQCNLADFNGLLEVAIPNHNLVSPGDDPPVEDSRMVVIEYVHDSWPTTVEACGVGVADFDSNAGYGDSDSVFTDNVDPNNCPVLGQ